MGFIHTWTRQQTAVRLFDIAVKLSINQLYSSGEALRSFLLMRFQNH